MDLASLKTEAPRWSDQPGCGLMKLLPVLPSDVLAAFKAHSDREAPAEACGLVLELPDQTLTLRVCRNVAKDPLENFEIDAVEWVLAEEEGEPVAILHSHPEAPARSSNIDRVMCAGTGIPWFILGQGDELMRVDPSDATPSDLASVHGLTCDKEM